MNKLFSFLFCILICLTSALLAQSMDFEAYDPPSTLVVPENDVRRAKYPFVDVHNHQWQMTTQNLVALAGQMDSLNMAVMVNLSGRGFRRITGDDGKPRFALQTADYLQTALQRAKADIPGRMIHFTNVDFDGVGRPGWIEDTVKQLTEDIQAGAQGLKIYKSLGFDVRDTDGQRVAVDDRRLAPIWETCGKLKVPVLIHTGEPAAFWMPHDANNERWLELKEKPGRYRDPATNPSWEQLMGEQHNVFRNHPGTVFINAHLGWMGNDLQRLGALLDQLPNVHTEIGAVLAELGRQPRFARKWLIRYQDRVMFGKDTWRVEEYGIYFRILETDDDYVKYYRRRHAFWRIYGLDLPDSVLRKIYYKNALRVIPGLDASLFPAD